MIVREMTFFGSIGFIGGLFIGEAEAGLIDGFRIGLAGVLARALCGESGYYFIVGLTTASTMARMSIGSPVFGHRVSSYASQFFSSGRFYRG